MSFSTISLLKIKIQVSIEIQKKNLALFPDDLIVSYWK